MDLRAVLYMILIGGALSINEDQLEGLKELIKNMPAGVYATCEIVLFSDLTDFNTADDNCRKFDIGAGEQVGNLATVNDEDKNTDMKLLLEMAYPIDEQPPGRWGPTNWVWAGLRKTNNKAKRTFYKNNRDDWEWANGEHPGSFGKWMRKQPDLRRFRKGEGRCTEEVCYQNEMRINHNGAWDDTFKFKKHPYACDYQGKYILSADLKTWRDAKATCEKAGLFLAKVRNPAEVSEMKEAMVYFLGEKDPLWKKWDSENWVWLGGTDEAVEGKWLWSDGQPIVWNFPWIPKAGGDDAKKVGSGVAMETGEDALTMNREGLFDDSFIEIIEKPFACQCPGS